MADRDTGIKMLQYYHDALVAQARWEIPSMDDLISYYDTASAGACLDGAGFAITQAGFNDSQVQESMTELADKTDPNKLPACNSFFQFLSNRAGELTWNDYAGIVQDTATQAVAVATSGLKTVTVIAGLALAAYVLFNVNKLRDMANGR